MTTCPKCGSERYPEDVFCGMCGIKLALPDRIPNLTQKEITVEDVRSKLGMVYFKMNKFEEAIEIFEKTLEINPNDQEARKMLGLIKEKLVESTDK